MEKTSKQAVACVIFSFFVMGFCDIVGISSDYAQKAFGWSDTTTGLVPAMVFVWFLFFSVPAGIRMNRWGRKNTVLIGMAVTIVGTLVPLLRGSWACLAGYALIGIGNAILQVSQNALVGHVVRNERLLSSSLTAGQFVKAISSFSGPFIMLFAVNVLGGGNTDNWYLAFPCLGAITLLSGLWLLLTPIEREEPQETTVTVASTFGLLRNPTMLLLFLGIFFVVGIDVGTNFTSSKILIQRFGWSLAEAGVAPQVYFICRTVGAFIGMLLMTRLSDVKYYRLNIVVCIAVLLVLAFVPVSAGVTLGLIGAVGFLCSCIFPTIFAQAVKTEPEKTNLISGLMITAVAGGGAFTPLIGMATQQMQTITAGIAVLLLCAAYLTYCAFFVKAKEKNTTTAV